MADAPTQSALRRGKLVVRNIGLLLSGDLARPILDADTIVAEGGHDHRRRPAQDLDTEGAAVVVDAARLRRRPRPDRQPRAPGVRRLDAAAEPARLDRQLPARRRDDDDLGGRGAPARPAEGHRRRQGAGDHRAARLRRLPARRRQGAGRCAGAREGHGRERLRRAGGGRRDAAGRGRPRWRQGSRARRSRWSPGRASTASAAPSTPAARRSPAPG